jgi:predicted DNA-binding protein
MNEQIVVRLPATVHKRLKAEVLRQARERPGIAFTVSDVVREMIEKSLRAPE